MVKARKISRVEGQDALDPVDMGHRCEPGVVDFGANDTMLFDETLPFREDRW